MSRKIEGSLQVAQALVGTVAGVIIGLVGAYNVFDGYSDLNEVVQRHGGWLDAIHADSTVFDPATTGLIDFAQLGIGSLVTVFGLNGARRGILGIGTGFRKIVGKPTRRASDK